MYPRFGMTYIAVRTAAARQQEAQLRQHDNPPADLPVPHLHSNDEAGAMWRMGAVVGLVVVLAGTIAVFA